MFIIAVFKILLRESRSILKPAKWGARSKRVNVSSKKYKRYLELAEIAWMVIELQY